MKNAIRRIATTAEPFVLNRERAEKISAIEGMVLSERMRAILDSADRECLGGDERRSLIREEVRKG